MTAPFAPPPSKPLIFVIVASLVVAIAIPFGRRDDIFGWMAFLAILFANIGIWGLLIYGIGRAIIRSRRGSDNVDSDS